MMYLIEKKPLAYLTFCHVASCMLGWLIFMVWIKFSITYFKKKFCHVANPIA